MLFSSNREEGGVRRMSTGAGLVAPIRAKAHTHTTGVAPQIKGPHYQPSAKDQPKAEVPTPN